MEDTELRSIVYGRYENRYHEYENRYHEYES